MDTSYPNFVIKIRISPWRINKPIIRPRNRKGLRVIRNPRFSVYLRPRGLPGLGAFSGLLSLLLFGFLLRLGFFRGRFSGIVIDEFQHGDFYAVTEPSSELH